MEEYTTKTDVENYLLQTINNSFNDQIAGWIKAMSSFIDKTANRVIFKDVSESAEPEEYFYDGDGSNNLLIKDCHDITEVKIDDKVVEVLKYPSNKPYTNKILLKTQAFTRGYQNVSVKATQAMCAELPEDIKFACTVLVAGICNNQIYKKKGKSEQIGNYTITYGNSQEADISLAKNIINSYKRVTF